MSTRTSGRTRRREPVHLGRLGKLAIASLWVGLCAVIGFAPILVPHKWHLVVRYRWVDGYRVYFEATCDQWFHHTHILGFFITAALMLLTVGVCARFVGHVFSVDVEPDVAEPGLEHVPKPCIALLREARAIRAESAAYERSLERAWRLTQSLAQASPEVRTWIEQSGAQLDGVHALVGHAAGPAPRRAERRHLRVRLDAELAAFEQALARPRGGYR